MTTTVVANPTMVQVADKALDKTGAVIEKAASMATDIFSAAAGIVTKGVEQYGPQVIDAVLMVVRIDAAQYLLIGWLTFFVCVYGLWFIATGFTKRDWDNRIMSNLGELGVVAVTVVFSTMVGVLLFSAIPRITDVWKYTAIVKPELYLVKKTIDLVETKLESAAKK